MSKEELAKPELSRKLLSDLIVHMKYSRFNEELKRREVWDEIVTRNKNMHLKKFPFLKGEIEAAYKFVYDKKVLPSMRSMQFAGKPIELSPNRLFNCGYDHADHWLFFSEMMFLLLGGSGMGYSVQNHHVAKLPDIKKPTKRTRRHLISDSIEGWADAVRALFKSYFFGESEVVFDFSDIRAKGSLLKTSGGKAPGPQPLKDCIHNLKKVLDSKAVGEKLTPIEVHDMVCYIADAVLSGGIRRSALICLFSIDNEDMLTCKFGNWHEANPQRARANNSAVVVRHKIKRKRFLELWSKIKASGSGEPGLYFTNDAEWGTNPCVEIALRPKQFCNLTTANTMDVVSQQDLEDRVRAAAFIGTLQASYTDFHYLREEWKSTTEKDSLLGVSMTGIASGVVGKLDLKKAAKVVKAENARVAALIKIRPGARTTCVKPEGTASLVVGSSSGIHAWHSAHYLRRVTVNKSESIYMYLSAKIPQLVEDDFFKPNQEAKILVPVKAPDGAIFRTESALDLLYRVKQVYSTWVKTGHRNGDNTHNVSATISVKDAEWTEVGNWMWENRKYYNGLSVLPWDVGTYVQAPFEECTKEKYEELLSFIKEVDLSKVKEMSDNTDLKGELACSGGSCEIK